MSSNRNHPFSHIPPLLAFSAEIRNQIYDYLCHRAAPIHLSFYHDTESNTPKPVMPFASNITIPTALFLTCRQINAEASSVFYSTNTFFINRRTKFATFIRPCSMSTLLKFFEMVGSRATLVRSVVFDSFTLCNSVFLCTGVDKATGFFGPGLDVLNITVLLREAWDRELNFTIGLVDVVNNVEVDRAVYWTETSIGVCTKTVVAIINSLLQGQLGVKGYGGLVRAVAVRRDGSGGLISWAGNPYVVVEFTAKDDGKQLEFTPRTLI